MEPLVKFFRSTAPIRPVPPFLSLSNQEKHSTPAYLLVIPSKERFSLHHNPSFYILHFPVIIVLRHPSILHQEQRSFSNFPPFREPVFLPQFLWPYRYCFLSSTGLLKPISFLVQVGPNCRLSLLGPANSMLTLCKSAKFKNMSRNLIPSHQFCICQQLTQVQNQLLDPTVAPCRRQTPTNREDKLLIIGLQLHILWEGP